MQIGRHPDSDSGVLFSSFLQGTLIQRSDKPIRQIRALNPKSRAVKSKQQPKAREHKHSSTRPPPPQSMVAVYQR